MGQVWNVVANAWQYLAKLEPFAWTRVALVAFFAVIVFAFARHLRILRKTHQRPNVALLVRRMPLVLLGAVMIGVFGIIAQSHNVERGMSVVAQFGVRISILTLLLVAFQLILAYQQILIASTQTQLAEDQKTIARDQLTLGQEQKAIAEREITLVENQGKIMEHQEREMNRRAKLYAYYDSPITSVVAITVINAGNKTAPTATLQLNLGAGRIYDVHGLSPLKMGLQWPEKYVYDIRVHERVFMSLYPIATSLGTFATLGVTTKTMEYRLMYDDMRPHDTIFMPLMNHAETIAKLKEDGILMD